MIIYFVGAFVAVPYWVVIIVCAILLALAVVGVVLTNESRTVIVGLKEKTDHDTRIYKILYQNLAEAVKLCQDEECKKALSKCLDDLKYSDPVSCKECYAVEDELLSQISSISLQPTLKTAETISNLIATRKKICKDNK